MPFMHALQGVQEAAWDSLATRTRANTPLVGICEVVTMHNGLARRHMLRARDSRLPTMRTMRRWGQKVTCSTFSSLSYIFCGVPEEDTGHMRITCERDAVLAPSP